MEKTSLSAASITNLEDAIQLLRNDPIAAAEKLEEMGYHLLDQAMKIRQMVADGQDTNPYKTPGGMIDRVQARVIGPDGSIKQVIDTDHQ